MTELKGLFEEAVALLKQLISTPSFSGEEEETAAIIESWFLRKNMESQRLGNNVWVKNLHFDAAKPTILLNSHHDTVKPNSNYTNNPLEAFEKDGKLFGLGSNDAGGCLVALMAVFAFFYTKENLAYNLVLAATAEEENSGENGIRSVLPKLPNLDFAIVGEPTEMQLAIAEKGLLVVDGYAEGIAGHAAHKNTVNAIYKAMQDIAWIENYSFPNSTESLGEVKMSVTQINAGTQHNVIPAACHFVIDVRINDAYTNKKVFQFIDENTQSKMVARSFKHNSSGIDKNHPIVASGLALGRTTYGSPTMSDQTALSCPSLKLGPGVSTRSHTADEFIFLKEIEEGIQLYINILKNVILKNTQA